MEKTVKSYSIINNLLFNKLPWKRPYGLLVHTSIIKKWEKAMHKTFPSTDWEMCEHILQIGNERFEMYLIMVLRSNKNQDDFLRVLVYDSQFSFPWEENPTLFIAAAEFRIMKKFINRNNLEAFILKIDEKLGYSVNGDHPIKVVSFNQSVSVKLDIINEFIKYRNGKNGGYLFVTNGLPWQQSNLLQRIRLNDNIYSVLPIILLHLGTLNYVNNLNIIDLLSLRLAISDVRDDPSNSNLLIYEIDFMIKRILAKLIKNNRLRIKKYLIGKNINPPGLLMFYLVHEFQHMFETVDVDSIYQSLQMSSILISDTIKLKEEIDVVNKLKKTSNIYYCIDGMGFGNMSLSLFVDLIKLKNINKIVLDTNYRWRKSMFISKLHRIKSEFSERFIQIDLIGQNTYNFIKGFTTDLKTITFVNNRILLTIYCSNLNNYRIFDDLKLYRIIFRDIKIDLNMLRKLQQRSKKPLISLYECSFENTSRNWQLINNLGKIEEINIYEDEGTWLSMFEFILKKIHKSNTNEFQFNRHITKIMEPIPLRGFIRLDFIKFVVDEQKSKLEIRCVKTNEVVDLYSKKCGIDQEDKSVYEFYQ